MRRLVEEYHVAPCLKTEHSWKLETIGNKQPRMCQLECNAHVRILTHGLLTSGVAAASWGSDDLDSFHGMRGCSPADVFVVLTLVHSFFSVSCEVFGENDGRLV